MRPHSSAPVCARQGMDGKVDTMKLRCDFVTNSSSSSFILARKGELNERQKKAIIDYVEREFLGKRVLAPGDTDDDIDRVDEEECLDFEYYADRRNKVKQALENGSGIYTGWMSFECSDSIAGVYEKIWDLLERNADTTWDFQTIDGDLSY